ncbi:MAG: PQQ-binding-like beta-propeller repeat protein [Pirellulales bacterium]
MKSTADIPRATALRALLRLVPLSALLSMTSAAALAEDWPNWRGPQNLGISTESNLPLTWSPTENIAWKVKLPERGNSTPIVSQGRIFITQALEKEHRRTLMCFDRADGQLLWQVGTDYAAAEPTHPTNPFCSASPVTDGERVIVWYGSAGVYCYDFQGRELWHRDLGIQEHEWGYAASPVLHGDLCFLNFGPGQREFVIALDKKTGESVWQFDIPQPPRVDVPDDQKTPAQRDAELRGSWSTPLVIRAGGRDELIMTLPQRVVAFDPPSGRTLWTCEGLGSLVYTSPMWGDGVLVALGGYHRACLAVRPGGAGDVTRSMRLWHQPKSKLRLGSGVIHKGHIYINDMQGVAQCLDLQTGEPVWEERLKASGSDNATWSSMVLTADERLYMLNQAGDTFVLRAQPKFELLATNSLGEMNNASVVISNGRILIRTFEHLWCVGPTGK